MNDDEPKAAFGMRPSPRSKLALLLCMAGAALHVYTVVFKAEGGLSYFLVGLLLWSWMPYTVSAALARFRRTETIALGAAMACLAADAVMHYSVFVAPRGSTAALGLLFMPLWNLVAVGPLGALLAWSAFRLIGMRAAAP